MIRLAICPSTRPYVPPTAPTRAGVRTGPPAPRCTGCRGRHGRSPAPATPRPWSPPSTTRLHQARVHCLGDRPADHPTPPSVPDRTGDPPQRPQGTDGAISCPYSDGWSPSRSSSTPRQMHSSTTTALRASNHVSLLPWRIRLFVAEVHAAHASTRCPTGLSSDPGQLPNWFRKAPRKRALTDASLGKRGARFVENVLPPGGAVGEVPTIYLTAPRPAARRTTRHTHSFPPLTFGLMADRDAVRHSLAVLVSGIDIRGHAARPKRSPTTCVAQERVHDPVALRPDLCTRQPGSLVVHEVRVDVGDVVGAYTMNTSSRC